MIHCGKARETMIDSVRRAASEAALLELDAHLAECAACHEERARFGLLESLRRYDPPALSTTARRRILDRLVAEPAVRTARAPEQRVWRRPLVVGFAVAAAVLLVAVAGLRARRGEAVVAVRNAPAIASEHSTPLAARESVRAGAATVSFDRSDDVRVRPGDHALVVARGEAEVIADGNAEPVRIAGRSASFAVRASRFVVSPSGVRSLDGELRVYDDGGRELAVVPAGYTWTAPTQPVPALPAVQPAPVAPPASASAPPVRRAPSAAPIAAAVVPSTMARPRAAAPAPKEATARSPRRLLENARSALGDGNAPAAREWLREAMMAGPSGHEQAVADLDWAESFLVERQTNQAIAAYRGVASRHAGEAEGETAAFTVGQLQFERGDHAEAATALRAYLSRYPHGRFTREAEDRLAQLRPAPR